MTRTLSTSTLHTNLFHLLEVSVRDDRQTILQQAEIKGLELDPETCQRARSDLTHPRRRLAVEVAWLPGMSPRGSAQALERLTEDPLSFQYKDGLPALALFNLRTAAFASIRPSDPAMLIGAFICSLAAAFDAVRAEEVLAEINADRVAAGMAEATDLAELQGLLHEQLRQSKNVVEATLDRLPPLTLLEAITDAVDAATANGEHLAGELIDMLVDSYDLRITPLLEQEAKVVHTLISSARAVADAEGDEATVQAVLNKLDKVTRNWDRFAQPIQLSMKARGLKHDASLDLAGELRGLAVDLFNNHQLIGCARFITDMLAEVFAELPEMVDIVSNDAKSLDEIEARWKAEALENVARDAEWARGVTFEADVGLVLKDRLSISPDGVTWKGKTYELDSIVAVRWGALRRSVNGIPSGTYYTVAFAYQGGSSVVIELRREATYTGFINALWRAVGLRLMTEMLHQLKNGMTLQIGSIQVRDGSTTLQRPRFLRSAEPVSCSWKEVSVWEGNGTFVVGTTSGNKVSGEASYMNNWNAIVLEHVVRGALRLGVDRLSSML